MAKNTSYEQSVPFLLVKIRDNALISEFNAIQTEIEINGGPQPDPEGFERLCDKLHRTQNISKK